MQTLESTEIKDKVKRIVGSVAGLDVGRIDDEASFRDDLNLDSLSLLEIGVDVDLAFELGLPDEAFREVGTLPQMVELVARRLAELEVQRPEGQRPEAQRKTGG